MGTIINLFETLVLMLRGWRRTADRGIWQHPILMKKLPKQAALKVKNRIAVKSIKLDRLPWAEPVEARDKQGQKFIKYNSAVVCWKAVDRYDRELSNVRRRGRLSQTKIITSSVKWQVIFLIINIALFMLVLKLI
jgi:hypothetical protein